MKIALDLDGTIAEYKTWKGIEHIGEPLPGAVEFCQALIDAGHEVWIFTTRTSTDVNKEPIRVLDNIVLDWLMEHGFNWEKILIWTGHGKMIADIYIDDRAYYHETNTPWDDLDIERLKLTRQI